MKNAPNLKHLPKEKFTEAIIFAGTDAYAHAKGWEEGMGKQIAEDTTPLSILGQSNWQSWITCKLLIKGAVAPVCIWPETSSRY
jgi:putative DNA primase/helicase